MYEIIFYLTAAIAVVAAGAILVLRHPVHAALYLIVCLLALALLFFLVGAPLVAMLQVILYAGAIMVLFLFLMMVMNLRPDRSRQRSLPAGWQGPVALTVFLWGEIFLLLGQFSLGANQMAAIGPKMVGMALFGPYLLAVEVVAILLLAALVAALYLSRTERP